MPFIKQINKYRIYPSHEVATAAKSICNMLFFLLSRRAAEKACTKLRKIIDNIAKYIFIY